jgi:hypothetical protein
LRYQTAGLPVHQISAPHGWVITSNLTDKTYLSMEDGADDDFFLSATLVGGVVTFGIATKAAGKSSPVKGEDLFQLMIDHFGASNVTTIRGRWRAIPGSSDNLDTFNRLTMPPTHLTEDQAALSTFTGKMADRKLGFAKTAFRNRLGSPGKYVEIEVDFTLP